MSFEMSFTGKLSGILSLVDGTVFGLELFDGSLMGIHFAFQAIESNLICLHLD
jgi:hypothetical protein